MATTDFLKEIKQHTPEAALAFFQQKGYEVGFDYRDVWGKSHATAFTAAKAMQLSVLKTLKDDIQKAVKDGVPFEKFKKEIVPQLTSQGWWGIQKITDPKTGKTKTINIGSSRLKNIYDTNLRMAHAEGQHIRIQDSKKVFPYLQYHGCNSIRPRPNHCAITGLTLPVDDATWSYLRPPRGFRCKCRVTQLTRSEGEKIADKPPKVRYENYENPRTGEKQKLPTFDYAFVNPKTGKAEIATWKADPAFNYPQGSYYEHLITHTLSEAANIPQAKKHTQKMLDSYKKLSKIGYRYKAVRNEWHELSTDERLALGTLILNDTKKEGKINDTLATTWQRQHYDNARNAIKKAESIDDDDDDDDDKKIMAGEALHELSFLMGMLSNLPESMQHVVPIEETK
jgi:hypothetical protein